MAADPPEHDQPEWERALDLHAAAPPFDYNPAAWSQRIPICVLAGVGFLIAAYMGLYQWGLIDSVWDPVFGEQTEKVLDSGTSERMRGWFGVPDSSFGAIAYLGDLIFGLAGSTRRWQYRPWMVLIFGFDVIPLGIVSVILVVMQGAVVGYWCFLCLVTALISLILIAMAYDEVWASIKYLHRVWKESRSWRVLWNTFIGRPSTVAARCALPEQRERGAAA